MEINVIKTTCKKSENNLNWLTEKLALNLDEIRITLCDSLKMNFLTTQRLSEAATETYSSKSMFCGTIEISWISQ